MSNSVRPQRWQPPKLCHPWDSPGKNTGVGCHFLLQCMKVKSESEVTQSSLTLLDPMDCSLSGSSVHEIFQARVLEWVAIAFSKITAASAKLVEVLSNLALSSVQFRCSVLSDSLRPHESKHTRTPCPSPTPGVHSDSHPSSQ